MMVTFVSQCQKKALNRTRRVLDSFANRIGDNTWQTVITNEGLNAVKKLLRKTASKSTAVSCHWIRSRNRSHFLWAVGNKNKFNSQGIVPVNYTSNKLITDEKMMNIGNYYANTKKQPLDQHLFSVGYVAYLLCKQLVGDEKLAMAVFVAGCWHDMGKVDHGFQAWLVIELKKKGVLDLVIPESGQHDDKKSKSYPRHNEVSLLLFYLLNKQEFPNPHTKKYAEHAIYWHHDKWFRGTEKNGNAKEFSLEMIYNKLIEKFGIDDVQTIFEVTRTLTNNINSISENYNQKESVFVNKAYSNVDEARLSEIEDSKIPKYKRYSEKLDVKAYQANITENAKNNIARTSVISADRLVSALSAEELKTHIEERTLHTLLEKSLLNDRGLKADLKDCLEGFENKYPDSKRNKQQQIAAQELSDEENSVAVLSGPAGCGKTKIALEWAANTHAKKIIWVCPRVQVCQGLVNDLIDEEYLPNTKIEICTGEFKTLYQNGDNNPTPEGLEFSGDIVLTTIDQVINTITTHTKITGLVQYMNAHVIFDEYHEYITMPAFNLLFAELVECKKLQNEKANALLVSATPNYYFIEELLSIDKDNVVSFESFNKSQYKIEFTTFDVTNEENNPLYQLQPENTFVISNTAITAQKSFIKNQEHEEALLFHSKFKKSDKQDLFEKVFNTFKNNGTKYYSVLRAGPIIQASLNITCNKMVSEFTNAENWLQRMGRLDRFGENNDANIYISAITEHVKNGKSLGNAKFLNNMNCLQSTKAWYEFLLSNDIDEKPITIATIYKIYDDFYDDEKCRIAIEQDMVTALKNSVEMLNARVMDPVSFPNKNKQKDDKPKIKKNSLRGDNRFVQMAIWNIGNNEEEFPNEYAYDESDTDGNLTVSVEIICGHGNSGKDLLAFMAKKHHNIKDESKKAYKDSILLGEARNPDTPIYLSYIPDDLKQVEALPHSSAIYYAVGKNQPIGSLSVNQIRTQGEEQ